MLLKLIHTIAQSLHYSELLLVSSELVLYFRDFFLDDRVDLDVLREDLEELRLLYEDDRLERDRLEEE